MKRYLNNLLLGLALLLLAGCGTAERKEQSPQMRVGVVLKAMDSQYWMELRSGIEQAALDLDVDAVVLYPSGEQEKSEQQDLIASMLDNAVDALIVAPCDSYDTQWFLQRAQAQNTVVLTVDTRALDSTLPYVGAENDSIGQTAAAYFGKKLPAGSRLAVLSGTSVQSTHQERTAAFSEALPSTFSLQTPMQIDSSFSAGFHGAELLQTQTIDGLFCTSAVIGLGASAAYAESTQPRPCIVAVDTQDDAVQAIRDGSIDALITQPGYDIGYTAIEQAVLAARGVEIAPETLLSVELLTKENIDNGGETNGSGTAG